MAEDYVIIKWCCWGNFCFQSKKRKVDEVEEAMDVDDTDTKSTFSYQGKVL